MTVALVLYAISIGLVIAGGGIALRWLCSSAFDAMNEVSKQ